MTKPYKAPLVKQAILSLLIVCLCTTTAGAREKKNKADKNPSQSIGADTAKPG